MVDFDFIIKYSSVVELNKILQNLSHEHETEVFGVIDHNTVSVMISDKPNESNIPSSIIKNNSIIFHSHPLRLQDKIDMFFSPFPSDDDVVSMYYHAYHNKYVINFVVSPFYNFIVILKPVKKLDYSEDKIQTQSKKLADTFFDKITDFCTDFMYPIMKNEKIDDESWIKYGFTKVHSPNKIGCEIKDCEKTKEEYRKYIFAIFLYLNQHIKDEMVTILTNNLIKIEPNIVPTLFMLKYRY